MAHHPDHDRGGATGPARARTAPQESAMTGTRTDPGDRGRDRRVPRPRWSFTGAAVRRRATGLAATAISLVTTAVVLILAVHIVFVTFEANTANDLVRWFGERATDLAWEFKDVFQPANPKAEVAVNYGLAALVYLVAGRVLVGIARRLAR
ncbi:hypothetical protein [Actinomadura rubrisoli]|uniref:Uncharacterized protein n=1 Tax=Actinomadura rubrisoli TaxID=2530368 RepID=A0A4R5AC57_9ACTN|nr:hypothetical protein [Actinomadura rubrisoli]TDD70008.1 hypothetical protein E1298_37010 [Actinomadura rubrisoli]